MALFDTLNMGIHTGAQTYISKKKMEGEFKLSKQEMQMKERLATMGINFQDKELMAKMAISQRRDTLFKQIALYVGVGLGSLILLITLGVLFISAKREEQFEYVIEEG
jgi:hypothetical protein